MAGPGWSDWRIARHRGAIWPKTRGMEFGRYATPSCVVNAGETTQGTAKYHHPGSCLARNGAAENRLKARPGSFRWTSAGTQCWCARRAGPRVEHLFFTILRMYQGQSPREGRAGSCRGGDEGEETWKARIILREAGMIGPLFVPTSCSAIFGLMTSDGFFRHAQRPFFGAVLAQPLRASGPMTTPSTFFSPSVSHRSG